MRNKNEEKNKSKKKYISLIIVVIIILLLILSTDIEITKNEKITYSEAKDLILSGEIAKVNMTADSINVILEGKDEKVYYTKIPDVTVFSEFMEKENISDDIKFEVKEKNNKLSGVLSILVTLLPFVLYVFMFKWIMKKMFMKDEIGNIISTDTSKTTFKDVAGIDNELAEVEEVVRILKNPKIYREMGAKIPKGILLVGEPGTGKTLIAKAIAGEADVKFYNCTGSNFENMFVGVGASKVRELFDEARKNAPSIIFIDEIDSIARNRYGNNNYHEQTLNQLLAEMDGFKDDSNVIIIAATNHLEVLDSAITRPGRFDRIINIPLPNKKGRKEILEVHSRGKNFSDDKEKILTELAKKTAGMSGAYLENILNEATLIAIKNEHECIKKEDVDEAFIKVILGVSKEDKEITEREKMLVAVHEAGHAVTSRVARPNLEILEVSIVPRGTAGGYTLYADKEEELPMEESLFKDIVTLLGGRAAEKAIYSSVSVGASSDLQKATKIAHKMVYQFAMKNDTQLVRIPGEEDFNNKIENEMFSSMESITKEAYNKALEIVEKQKECIIKLAKVLTEESTLDYSRIEEIFTQYNI